MYRQAPAIATPIFSGRTKSSRCRRSGSTRPGRLDRKPQRSASALHIDRVVVVHPSPYGADNACTVDAVRAMGARARGVAVIDDATTDAELDDMHHAGIRGVRVNLRRRAKAIPPAPDAASYASRRARRAARLARADLHQSRRSGAAARRHHGTADAAGGRPFRAGAGRARHQPAGLCRILSLLRSGKVYIKISAAYRISEAPGYADAAPIARAMIEANPERVVWGTDWPHPGVSTGRARSERGRAVPAGRRWRGAQPARWLDQRTRRNCEDPGR